MVHQSSILRLKPEVAIEDFGDRSLALHCVNLHLIELNATARDLLARLDGCASLQDIAVSIAQEYDQDPVSVLADIEEVIDQMIALDIVECVVPGSMDHVSDG